MGIVTDEMIKMLSEDEINRWWFGTWGTNPDRREIIREALAELAADFDCGSTIKTILRDLGLIGKSYRYPKLTKKGRRYLFWANEHALSLARGRGGL